MSNCGCTGDQCALDADGLFKVIKKKKGSDDNLRTEK